MRKTRSIVIPLMGAFDFKTPIVGWKRANPTMIRMLFATLALSAATACADWRDEMWKRPVDVREGVSIRAYALDRPRMMKAYVARIDLMTPGIGFTATERAAEWGKAMPDYKKRKVKIDTRREKSSDFMKRRRRAGKNVEVAVNTSPWGPWVHPYTHRYGNFCNWNVSDGVRVSHVREPKRGSFFVVRKDGSVDITAGIPLSETNNVSISMHGFWMIMTNGAPAYAACQRTESLAPRTALGLTADRKTLVLLAIDGRQPGYSLGASSRDIFDLMKREGVSDAVNMDGGGSVSLVVYDRANDRPLMLNHHHGGVERKVAMSLGIIFDDKKKK